MQAHAMIFPETILATQPEAIASLVQEARMLERCAHPNVAELCEFILEADHASLTIAKPTYPFIGECLLANPPFATRIALAKSLAQTFLALRNRNVCLNMTSLSHVVVRDDDTCVIARLCAATHTDDPVALAKDERQFLSLLHDALGVGDPLRPSATSLTPRQTKMAAQVRNVQTVTELLAILQHEDVRRLRKKRSTQSRRRLSCLRNKYIGVIVASTAIVVSVFLFVDRRTESESFVAQQQSEVVATTPLKLASNVLLHENQRYEVGDEGDKIFVGDWNCNGTYSVVIQQAQTGDIYRFFSWPDSDSSITSVLSDHVASTAQLRQEHDAKSGCDALRDTTSARALKLGQA